MNVQPGTLIGPYRVESLIGRGGMSEVYKVWNEGLQRYEALKILPEPMAFDTHFVRRFLDNERMAASLHHPNIVTIYAVGRPDTPPYYFSMEYIEGGDLAEMISTRGRLSLTEAVPLLHQIASALDYAHSHGVVHRDIKPANVLLEKRDPQLNHTLPGESLPAAWDAKVVDFGIARAIGESGMTRFTQTGMFVGTPEYMSPEQAGSGHEVDHRTDLYSLGIIAYEMLCGRPPFRAAQDTSPLAVIVKHLHNNPPSPRDFAPHLSEATSAVLLKALAKDPVQRFASGADFVESLAATGETAALSSTPAAPVAEVDETLPITSVAPTVADVTARTAPAPAPARRSRVPLLVFALGLACLLVGWAWWRVNHLIVLEENASGIPTLVISRLGEGGALAAGRKIVAQGHARNISGEPTARLWREQNGRAQYWSQDRWLSGDLPATAIENVVSYQPRTRSWSWPLPAMEPGEYHLRVAVKNAEGVKNAEEISFRVVAPATSATPSTTPVPAPTATAAPTATPAPRPAPAAVLTIETPASGGTYQTSQLKQMRGVAKEIASSPTIQLWRETPTGTTKSFQLDGKTRQRRFTPVAGLKSFYSSKDGRWQVNLPSLSPDFYLVTISAQGRNGQTAQQQKAFRIYRPVPKPLKITEERPARRESHVAKRETARPRAVKRVAPRPARSPQPAPSRPAPHSAPRPSVPRPSVPRPAVPRPREVPRPN